MRLDDDFFDHDDFETRNELQAELEYLREAITITLPQRKKALRRRTYQVRRALVYYESVWVVARNKREALRLAHHLGWGSQEAALEHLKTVRSTQWWTTALSYKIFHVKVWRNGRKKPLT